MKRTMLLLAFCGMLTAAMADWTYGTARFSWEGTGDICVVYPKDYRGPQMRFTSTGGTVQIQTLK